MKNNNTKTKTKQEIKPLSNNKTDLLADLKDNNIGFFNVEGDASFEYLGINRGDIVIVRAAKENDEDLLTCWDLPGGYDFGFAYDNFGDISLRVGDKVSRYKNKEAELLGAIIGVIKPFDARNPNNLSIESEEITARCDKCRAELTGTPEFIKKQGWELEANKTLCLNCGLFGGGR